MSQDFTKTLVKDDRLMVTDSVSYAVVKGGSSMTASQFQAISNSPSSITFNVQVPSQETIVSRNLQIQNVMTFTVIGTPLPQNPLFVYGESEAFAPFPFNQMVNTQTFSINNTTVSQNTKEILSVLTRIHDKRELSRYNGMCPTLFDSYKYYSDAQGTNNNPLASFSNLADNDLIPRGAFPPSSIVYTRNDTGAVVPDVALLADGLLSFTATIQITTTEPILVSPWAFGSVDGQQGMYGIQNLNAVFNLNPIVNRAWRSCGGYCAILPTVTLTAITSTLLFQFISPHPSDLMPSRNVVPYYELPRYFTTGLNDMAPGTTQRISSQSLQLNQIPDKLYIVVQKTQSAQNITDSDSWLTINSISINWNNQSGILSSATQQDLFRMSVENGVNQNWLEFSGRAGAVGGYTTYTCGSVLCLEFGKDIELQQDYYAPGSLGNFNLQLTLNATNNSSDYLPGRNLQLMVITQNSGVFSLERGVASSYLGILTKSDVLEASRQTPHAYTEALRMVGGKGFFNRIKSTLGKVMPKIWEHVGRPLVQHHKHNLGLGMSGAGGSGSGTSGGMGSLEDRIM